MTDPDENEPYRVEAAPGAFQIVNAAGEAVLLCTDKENASQYAAMLSQAYRRGYRAGYRAARAAPSDRVIE